MSVEEFKQQIEEELEKLDAEKAEEDQESPVAESPEVVEDKPQYTEVELKAIEMGWKPDHKGPNFVSAKEYVDRSSFFKAIDSRNRKIDDLEMAVKELLDHNKKLSEMTREDKINELLQKRNSAVMSGDIDEFNQAEYEINRLEQTKPPVQQAVNVPPQPPKEALEFQDRNNAWFNYSSEENKRMTDLAIAYDSYLRSANPGMSTNDILKEVEDTIKIKYPHRFQNVEKEKPAMVSKSTTSKSSGESELVSKLSERQRSVFRQAKALDSSLTIQEYARQLKLTGALKDE